MATANQIAGRVPHEDALYTEACDVPPNKRQRTSRKRPRTEAAASLHKQMKAHRQRLQQSNAVDTQRLPHKSPLQRHEAVPMQRVIARSVQYDPDNPQGNPQGLHFDDATGILYIGGVCFQAGTDSYVVTQLGFDLSQQDKAEPCEICGRTDGTRLECNRCSGAFHKECVNLAKTPQQRFWTCPGCHEQRRHFDPPPGFPLQKHFLHGGPNIHVCRITEIWQTDEGVLFNCQWYESRNVLEENDRHVFDAKQVYRCETTDPTPQDARALVKPVEVLSSAEFFDEKCLRHTLHRDVFLCKSLLSATPGAAPIALEGELSEGHSCDDMDDVDVDSSDEESDDDYAPYGQMQGQQLPLPSRQQASQDSWEGADRQPKRRRHQQASAQAGPSKRQKQDQAVAQPDTSNLQEPSNSSQTEDDSVSDGNEGQVQSSSSQAQESAGQDLAPGHADPSEPVGPSDPSDSGQAQHNHLTPAPAQAIVGSASTDMEEADAAAEEDRSTEALLLRQQPTSTELLLPTQSTQPLSGLEATASASAQSEADGREAQHVAQHSATKQAHAGRNGGSADMPAAKTAEQDELQAAARPESQGAAVVTQRGSKQTNHTGQLTKADRKRMRKERKRMKKLDKMAQQLDAEEMQHDAPTDGVEPCPDVDTSGGGAEQAAKEQLAQQLPAQQQLPRQRSGDKASVPSAAAQLAEAAPSSKHHSTGLHTAEQLSRRLHSSAQPSDAWQIAEPPSARQQQNDLPQSRPLTSAQPSQQQQAEELYSGTPDVVDEPVAMLVTQEPAVAEVLSEDSLQLVQTAVRLRLLLLEAANTGAGCDSGSQGSPGPATGGPMQGVPGPLQDSDSPQEERGMGPASNSIQDLGDMDTDCSDADQAGDMDNELELGNGCPADRGTTSDEEEQAGLVEQEPTALDTDGGIQEEANAPAAADALHQGIPPVPIIPIPQQPEVAQAAPQAKSWAASREAQLAALSRFRFEQEAAVRAGNRAKAKEQLAAIAEAKTRAQPGIQAAAWARRTACDAMEAEVRAHNWAIHDARLEAQEAAAAQARAQPGCSPADCHGNDDTCHELSGQEEMSEQGAADSCPLSDSIDITADLLEGMPEVSSADRGGGSPQELPEQPEGSGRDTAEPKQPDSRPIGPGSKPTVRKRPGEACIDSMLAEYEAMSLRHAEDCTKTDAEAQLDEALQLLAPTAFAGKVVCRDTQKAAIRSFIKNALAGSHGRFLEVRGEPGSGRTTTVLEVVASLQADAADLAFGHIVCPTARNFFTTLWQVLTQPDQVPTIEACRRQLNLRFLPAEPKSCPAWLCQTECEEEPASGSFTLLLIEGFDQLVKSNPQAIEALATWLRTEHTDNLVVIGTTVSSKWHSEVNLDNLHQLHLSRCTLSFPEYSRHEMAAILAARMISEDLLAPFVLLYTATRVKSRTTNAERMITSLWVCKQALAMAFEARHQPAAAAPSLSGLVHPDHVHAVLVKLSTSSWQQAISNLPARDALLLEAMCRLLVLSPYQPRRGLRAFAKPASVSFKAVVDCMMQEPSAGQGIHTMCTSVQTLISLNLVCCSKLTLTVDTKLSLVHCVDQVAELLHGRREHNADVLH